MSKFMMIAPGLVSAVVLTALAACAPVETSEPTPTPPVSGQKVCRAENYQRYIGRNQSELPATPADENWRLACSTCAVTMDYREDRLTIVYNTQTNLIQSARCG